MGTTLRYHPPESLPGVCGPQLGGHQRQRRRHGTLAQWLLLALAMGCCGTAISANVGGAVAVTSQLIDRGVSIAPNKVTLQTAGYWLPAPGWSVSGSVALQASSLSEPVAVTAQAARSWMLDDRWQMQASVLYYAYPSDRASRAFDRQEASLAWSYRDLLTASVSVFNYPNSTESPWNVAADVTFNVPLSAEFLLCLGAGSSRFPTRAYGMTTTGRYQYGQIGLKWNRAKWSVELDRVMAGGNMPRMRGGPQDAPWLATVTHTF